MIVALDIETLPNADAIATLPEPTIDSRLKDPAKIADARAAAKAKQLDTMALDPMTARIACYAAVGLVEFGLADAESGEFSEIIEETTDDAERAMVQSILRMLGNDEVRLVTWNGIGFDLPMIYKRALLLGVSPADFAAPPLTAWTKRYDATRHFDLMQLWCGWQSHEYAKLETVARTVLGEVRDDIDYALMPELMKTPEGRAAIASANLNHTRLTLRLWQRFNGVLFA